jgi:hypothetical protein
MRSLRKPASGLWRNPDSWGLCAGPWSARALNQTFRAFSNASSASRTPHFGQGFLNSSTPGMSFSADPVSHRTCRSPAPSLPSMTPLVPEGGAWGNTSRLELRPRPRGKLPVQPFQSVFPDHGNTSSNQHTAVERRHSQPPCPCTYLGPCGMPCIRLRDLPLPYETIRDSVHLPPGFHAAGERMPSPVRRLDWRCPLHPAPGRRGSCLMPGAGVLKRSCSMI